MDAIERITLSKDPAEIVKFVFLVGRSGFNYKNVGPKTLRELENVLYLNGFNTDDWKRR